MGDSHSAEPSSRHGPIDVRAVSSTPSMRVLSMFAGLKLASKPIRSSMELRYTEIAADVSRAFQRRLVSKLVDRSGRSAGLLKLGK